MESLINKIHNCKNQDILPLLPDKSISVFLVADGLIMEQIAIASRTRP